MESLLSITVFFPLAGAAAILAIRGSGPAELRNARRLAMFVTLATLAFALALLYGFDSADSGFQFVEERVWFGGLTYKLGVDGISLPFVLLTAALMPIAIGASWRIELRVKEYLAAFLVLETLMLGVFAALDLVLFYLFFEGGLIPMFLIIGIWGGARRVYAAFKFFLYTLLGSLLMLIAMIAMFGEAGTTHIDDLLRHDFPSQALEVLGLHIPGGMQTLLWFAFLASFAVKLPMWPVHTWLPDAHVEAPTAGSVILAAVLLKMGGYGFLRFSLPMLPVASELLAPLMFALGAIAIVYASLVALMQEDVKKLIAYSSVAHMGFVTIGIFSANRQGVDGAVFQMLSHGVVSAALFLLVGVLYDRTKTRRIADFGGLVERMPVFAAVFLLFSLANVGLPGTSGFVGEFLAMTGVFLESPAYAAAAALGVILSAAYALWLYRRVTLGAFDASNEKLANITDMDLRERAIFVPLVIGTLALGIFPSVALDLWDSAVTGLLDSLQTAATAAASAGRG